MSAILKQKQAKNTARTADLVLFLELYDPTDVSVLSSRVHNGICGVKTPEKNQESCSLNIIAKP